MANRKGQLPRSKAPQSTAGDEHALLAAILASAVQGIWVIDAQNRTTLVNERMAAMLGYDVAEMLGRSLLDFMDAEGIRFAEANLERRRRGIAEQHDFKFRRKDGQDLWTIISTHPLYDGEGNYAGALGMVSDITERKDAERLHEALHTIDRIILSVLDFDVVMQQTVTLAAEAIGCETAAISLRRDNRWVVSYVHGFPQDVIGTVMNDEEERHAVLAIQTKRPVAVDDAFNDERVDREHMRKWDVRSVLAVPLLTRDEVVGVLFFNHHSSAFAFADRHVDFALKLAASVSLALGNAGLVAKLETELSQRKRVEVQREELLRTISHDLRQPLTVIQGQVDVLQRLLAKGVTDERVQTGLRSVKVNAQRLWAMTRDLVESSRLEAEVIQLNKQQTNLSAFLFDSIERAFPSEERLRVELIVPDWEQTVAIDSERMERVVVNLVANALRYSPPESPVEVGFSLTNGEVVVAVRDHGVGIAPENQQRLFRRYYRTSKGEKSEGLGLGLYIARLIVEAHGGRIWVESEVDKGSNFFLSLPAV